ncbi:MAG: protein translocase subunit SecF [Desulfovibrionaceae bacterium]|nr:protein translocase subunit SecF [Desulfovibrionaceae bacterium]
MALVLVKPGTKIDFAGKRYLAYGLSIALLLLGLGASFFGSGFKLGIDFAGGVIMQIHFAQPVDDEALKASLDVPALPGISTQRFGEGGSDYLLRFSKTQDGDASVLRTQVMQQLQQHFPNNACSIERMEVVGPKVGSDLANKALSALYYAILLIAVYISGRFEQRWMAAAAMAAVLWGCMYALSSIAVLSIGWLVLLALLITLVICFVLHLNFALGAIIALIHDVSITTGFLAISGIDIDLNVIAALLTIIGYSLNDTIIIYDRIRENLRTIKDVTLEQLINLSVNQTLSRTVLTSGTTIMAALALFILGGGVIHSFALTMLIGVIIGTYSSIYISSSLLLAFGNREYYVASQKREVYEKPGEHGIV